MTYEEAREYTGTISKSGSIMGLASIRRLMERLFDVQEKLSVIHIAGTNGKGSVGAFLSYGLMEAGYCVGRYTSPAVFSPLEIWQVNGKAISAEDYTAILSQVKDACDILVSEGLQQPTVFEVETAVAFLYFYRKKCDYVILETGMGGAFDATNLITHPACSVITSIGMDHMHFLGNRLSEIAQAKAGIIKMHCPVVTVRQKAEVMEVLLARADACETELLTAEPDMARETEESATEISYLYCSGKERIRITLPMGGGYQVDNSLLAIFTLRRVFQIPLETIAAGLGRAVWPGRFEVIGEEPLLIIDGAHNEDAAEKLCRTLQNYFTNRDITYIIGVLADKEYDKMLKRLLPLAKRVYTVTPQNPRALPADLLAAAATECAEHAACNKEDDRSAHLAVKACASVREAVQLALEQSERTDVILAFGSLSYLGEVKREFGSFAAAAQDADRF